MVVRSVALGGSSSLRANRRGGPEQEALRVRRRRGALVLWVIGGSELAWLGVLGYIALRVLP